MKPGFYFLFASLFSFYSLTAQDTTQQATQQVTTQESVRTTPQRTTQRTPARTVQNNDDELSLDRGTISNQFEYVITKSSRYQEYKVVREAWLSRLRAHVADSINELKNDLAQAQNTLKTNNSKVDSLRSQLQQTEERLQTSIKEKNSISLLGINTDKGVYNSIMFFILAALAISLLIFIFLFKRSNHVTVQTRKDLEETRDEFDKYRKHAREKEERLVVKHHDEMMKLKRQQGGI